MAVLLSFNYYLKYDVKSYQFPGLTDGSFCYNLENFSFALTPVPMCALTARFISPIYRSIYSNFFAFISYSRSFLLFSYSYLMCLMFLLTVIFSLNSSLFSFISFSKVSWFSCSNFLVLVLISDSASFSLMISPPKSIGLTYSFIVFSVSFLFLNWFICCEYSNS